MAGFIEWIGEIGEAEKSDFLGTRRALLFPVHGRSRSGWR